MKKIDFNYGEIVYKEVLDNGLTVYLYPTNKSKNFYITVSTHFGAEVMSYKKNNKVYDVTKGSAHFLEHRVMDFTKNVDAMNKINELGSIVNAYTTYKGTNYNLYGVEDIYTNMGLLFDRVFKANIKKEDVEMERGIILEEYYMYDADPYYKAQTTLLKNCFNSSFIKYLVIGTEDGIKTVSYKELNRLYKDFYTLDNMFIVVTGNFILEDVLNYINNYMKDIKTTKCNCKVIKPVENYKVNVSYEELTGSTDEAKIVIGYKVKNSNPKKKIVNRLLMDMILSENFDKTGSSYLRLMNEGLNRFSYFVEEVDDYFLIAFTGSTNEYEKFTNIIDEEIKNLDFTKEALERKTKGYISNLILSFEYIENVEDNITSGLFDYNKVLNDMESIIKKVTLNDVKEVIKCIDTTNKSVLIMKK
ncbi:m16C subfamily protease [Clostridium sp. CAG:628]|nr:m16C subfamily protease [Clostridium sp. CAG:628]